MMEATFSTVQQYFYTVRCSTAGMSNPLDKKAVALEAYADLAVHILKCCKGKGDSHHQSFITELELMFFREFHYAPSDETDDSDHNYAVHSA